MFPSILIENVQNYGFKRSPLKSFPTLLKEVIERHKNSN
jgi:hypothetical protein